MIEQSTLGVWGFILAILGLFIQVIHLYRDKKKEEAHKPKLLATLRNSTHNSEKVIPNLTITNKGELPTSISQIEVIFNSVTKGLLESGSTLSDLKKPIKVEGKGTIYFTDPLYAQGGDFPEEDLIVSLKIFYTEGQVISEKIISTFHKNPEAVSRETS